jgi:hypothetical protein
MEAGFLGAGSLTSGAKWFREKKKLGTGGSPLAKPDGLGMVYLPGFRCQGCKLLLLNY